MDEFYIFLSNVRTTYTGGGWDVCRADSGVGLNGSKKSRLGHLWTSHDANRHPHTTMAYATLIGQRDIQSAVGTILGPHSIGATALVVTMEGMAKCPPGKQTS